jgi:hypothetical protein
VDQPGDTMVYNKFSELFEVQYIRIYKWAWWKETGIQTDRRTDKQTDDRDWFIGDGMLIEFTWLFQFYLYIWI